MSAEEDVARVVELALLTEDRAPEEQRALMRVAHRLDKARNRDTTGHPPVSPPSVLYLECLGTYRPSVGMRVRELPKAAEYYERKGLR